MAQRKQTIRSRSHREKAAEPGIKLRHLAPESVSLATYSQIEERRNPDGDVREYQDGLDLVK
jgi:hypothetical protein